MKDLPHRVVMGKRLHWEATDWCTEKFGRRWDAVGHRQGTWCVFWLGPGRDFAHYEWNFAYEQDAILFSLRWL
jgi:hypothetical protein